MNEMLQITSTASYAYKHQFIAIPIVAQAQQGNETLNYVPPYTSSFWYCKSNSHAWKSNPPPPPPPI